METIKSSARISYLFKEGRRIGTPDITLIVLRNEEQHDHYGRAAFIAGKRQGNAVWRNRAKRRMRALYAETYDSFTGYDVLFIAKKSTIEASYSTMLINLRAALLRAEIVEVTESVGTRTS